MRCVLEIRGLWCVYGYEMITRRKGRFSLALAPREQNPSYFLCYHGSEMLGYSCGWAGQPTGSRTRVSQI